MTGNERTGGPYLDLSLDHDREMVIRMIEQVETNFKLLANQAQVGISTIRSIRHMLRLPEERK